MNASAFVPRLLGAATALFLLGISHPVVRADDTQPVITGIRLEGTNVLVTVRVPAGLKKVMIEGRQAMGKGAWVPRAVQRIPDATAKTLEFRLPQSSKIETLRVRADRDELLVAQAYQGADRFSGSPGAPNNAPVSAEFDGVGAGPARDGSTSREVVESDIWKRNGDTLYFFNQFRGLQILDVSQPDSPQLRGQIVLPAAGDQMYLLNSTHVILLARNDCSYGPAGPESEVVLVAVTNAAQPQITTRLGVGGYIAESRLVGTALYLATQTYRQRTNALGEVYWEWGTTVTSFDFADPAAPARGDSIWFSGWGHVIQATDQYLFLAHTLPNGGWPMEVEIVDISDPRGAMKYQSKVKVAGNVADKFKINQNGDVLTVISFGWYDDRRWVTVLETFSLTTPTAPQALGRLELAAGEQLHATRFDGHRVYVVTFLRIDPLWIVDLTDPAVPRIAGELEVPGWSTYIQPLGDRLVSIGIDPTNGWRVAVSLFDVRDPAKPALYDKELLGENYSWSEANYDEKAFSVLPESGLIMVPYQGYLTNGLASRIQLIDLGATNLTLRGQIEHAMQPRRATLHRERIYSISGSEFLAVDATDRDHPLLRASIALSWSVDRVFLAGNHVVQVTDGASMSGGWYFRGWSSETQPPAIRVATVAQPNQVLSLWLPEKPWPVLGATRQGDRLFVLQGRRPDTGDPIPTDTNLPPAKLTNIVLTVLDLSQLPTLTVAAQVGAAVGELAWGATFDPLWVTSNVLSWSERQSYYYWWWDIGPVRGGGGIGIDVIPGLPGVSPPPYYYPWGGGGSSTGRLLTFGTAPVKWLSELTSLGGTESWSTSLPVTLNGLVFASDTTYETVTNIIDGRPYVQWVAHRWLAVADFADPVNPTLRPKSELPGDLVGVSHGGEVIYTQGQKTWATNDNSGQEWLAAVAYDGVATHLADSMPLPNTWPHPLVIRDGFVYLTRSATNGLTAELEVWQLSASTAKLTQLGGTSLPPNGYTLTSVGAYLGSSDGRNTTLLDISQPASPRLWLKGEFEGCMSGSLDHADANAEQGLMVPWGNYGVGRIPAP